MINELTVKTKSNYITLRYIPQLYLMQLFWIPLSEIQKGYDGAVAVIDLF